MTVRQLGWGRSSPAYEGTADVEPVDSTVLDQLCQRIGRQGVREIVELFLAGLDSAVPALEQGCRDRDREGLAATAHRLKSGARSLGAAPLGELLQRLEQSSGESDWEPLAELVAQVNQARGTVRDQMLAQLGGWSPDPGPVAPVQL